MLGVRPSDSISLRKHWDWRFRFYWAKKHYVAELLRLGFSVLQADSDTVWVHDPFPALHQICKASNATLVAQVCLYALYKCFIALANTLAHPRPRPRPQMDNPFVNAGLFYARPSTTGFTISTPG